MASSWETYLKREQTEADKRQKSYEKQRKKQAEAELTAAEQDIDARAAAQTAAHEESLTQAKRDFRRQYNENAVEEMILKRQVAERMAGLGLSQSGTARSGRQAASAVRQRADRSVTVERQAAVERLNRLITAVREESAADKRQAQVKAASAAQKDAESYRQKQQTLAQSRAKAAYEAAQKASISEKRAEYAKLLIRQKYSAEEAWREAYRRYPKEAKG